MSLVVYFIKVSAAIFLFYLLYVILFRKLTFFRFNRIYLLMTAVLALLLPFLHFPVQEKAMIMFEPVMAIDWDHIMEFSAEPALAGSNVPERMSLFPFIIGAYSLVVLAMLGRTLFAYIRLRRSFNGSTVFYREGIRHIVHVNNIAPFTLFRTVYLDQYTYDNGNQAILNHELVHARQLHSVDLLFYEIICAFLWFNPFVFLSKKQIRDNHEFLADQVARNSAKDLVEYLQTLSAELTRKFDPVFASSFQSSTLKKRIIMLTNRKSDNKKKILYLFIIPVAAIALVAFQNPVDRAMDEAGILQIEHGNVTPVQSVQGPDLPERFPLDEKYKSGMTAGYNKVFKNPITGKTAAHKGIDYKAPVGTPVYAAGNGVVVKSEFVENYGKVVIIEHDNETASLYAHLNKLDVAVGQKVTKGFRIGEVGNTGYSTGPHLHYEIRVAGENVDPSDYFTAK